jgi:DNA-binding NarL/FixJ family response regulator
MAADEGALQLRKKRCWCGAGHMSDRRFEVFEGVVEGLFAREIATALYITVNTVNTHIKGIYQLAGVNCREDLLKVSLAQGLLEVTPDAKLKITGKTCIWPRGQWPRPAYLSRS